MTPTYVLDPKAAIEGRRSGRVPVGAIITIAVSALALLVFLVLLTLTGMLSHVSVFLLAVVPLGLWIPLVLLLDRLEPEPKIDLVMAFLWGAGIATGAALVLEMLGDSLLSGIVGSDKAELVGVAVVAPVIEEIAKGAILFGLFWFKRAELNGPTDGVVYASLVALGFAAVEDIVYYGSAYEDGSLGATFFLRGICTPLLHPIFTSLTGVAIAAAAMRRPGALRVLLPILGLLGAIAMHGLWNGAASVAGLGGLVVAFLVCLVVLIVLLVVVFRDRKRTVALIGASMSAYIPTGLVTPGDIAMLSTLGARRYARRWARQAHGPQGARAMGDYQQACTQLALLHERAARGIMTPQEFESRRAPLVTLMGFARETFLAPVEPAGFVTHPAPAGFMAPPAAAPRAAGGWAAPWPGAPSPVAPQPIMPAQAWAAAPWGAQPVWTPPANPAAPPAWTQPVWGGPRG